MPPKASKNRKAANGYRLPDALPEGEILTGLTKKSWRLGKSIGVGGFGEIYLCSEDTSRAVGEDAPLAMKIEPHENGPLFVEMNFYIRAAQEADVMQYRKSRGLTNLGMPVHRGSGSHKFKNERYRFLVMDRYGRDLEHLFQSGQRPFSLQTAFNLAIKIIDVLEYIHSRGYVHNDIKAQNLLLGYGRAKEHDVYLVDFGLVSKYQREGVHLEYKPDARKAHDGTIEYTSRDAHIGAHSRRSDLEILGYNLVHWMSGHLPWMDNLTNPQYVFGQKKHCLGDISAFLEKCFGENEFPAELEEFFQYVIALEFHEVPDYERCKDMFKKGLKKRKFSLDGKIDFAAAKKASPTKKGRPTKSRRRPTRGKSKGVPANQPPSPSMESLMGIESGAVTRSGEAEEMNNWCWEKVLCSDPEMLIRQASRQSESESQNPLALQLKALDEKKQAESLKNPTPVMQALIQRMEDREAERQQMSWQQQLHHLTGRKNSMQRNNSVVWDLTPNPLTPAMEEVIAMRSRRISVDYDIPITPEPSSDEDAFLESDEDESNEPSDDEDYRPRGSPIKKRSPTVNTSSNKTPVNRRNLKGQRHSPLRKCSTNAKASIPPRNPDIKVRLNENPGKENGAVDAKSLRSILKEDINLVQQREALKKFEEMAARKKVTQELNECSLASNGNTHIPDNGGTTTPKGVKGGPRRISIQNEAQLIRNKDSPPDKTPWQPVLNSTGRARKSKQSKETWQLSGKIETQDDTDLEEFHGFPSDQKSLDRRRESPITPDKSSPRKTRSKSKDTSASSLPLSKKSTWWRRNLTKTAFAAETRPAYPKEGLFNGEETQRRHSPDLLDSRGESSTNSPEPEHSVPETKQWDEPIVSKEPPPKSIRSKKRALSPDIEDGLATPPPPQKKSRVFSIESPNNDDLFDQLLMSGVKNKIFKQSLFPTQSSRPAEEAIEGDLVFDEVGATSEENDESQDVPTPEPPMLEKRLKTKKNKAKKRKLAKIHDDDDSDLEPLRPSKKSKSKKVHPEKHTKLNQTGDDVSDGLSTKLGRSLKGRAARKAAKKARRKAKKMKKAEAKSQSTSHLAAPIGDRSISSAILRTTRSGGISKRKKRK